MSWTPLTGVSASYPLTSELPCAARLDATMKDGVSRTTLTLTTSPAQLRPPPWPPPPGVMLMTCWERLPAPSVWGCGRLHLFLKFPQQFGAPALGAVLFLDRGCVRSRR